MKQIAIGVVLGFVLATSGVQGIAKLVDNMTGLAKEQVIKATN